MITFRQFSCSIIGSVARAQICSITKTPNSLVYSLTPWLMLHSRAPRMVSLSKLRSLSSDGAFTCIKLGCGNVFQTNAGRSTWTATNGYNLYYQITHYSWAIFWYSIHDLNKSFCPSCFSVNSCAIIFANFLSCCSEIRGHHVNVPHWRNLFFRFFRHHMNARQITLSLTHSAFLTSPSVPTESAGIQHFCSCFSRWTAASLPFPLKFGPEIARFMWKKHVKSIWKHSLSFTIYDGKCCI